MLQLSACVLRCAVIIYYLFVNLYILYISLFCVIIIICVMVQTLFTLISLFCWFALF